MGGIVQSVVVRYDREDEAPRCSCGAWSVLVVDQVEADCGDISLTGKIPTLACPVCSSQWFLRPSTVTLRSVAKEAWKRSLIRDKVDFRADTLAHQRFQYCGQVSFIYDPVDYFYSLDW